MIVKNKHWYKPPVTPITGKVIRQIALDKEIYGYQVIDEVFRRVYPEYYTEKEDTQVKMSAK